MMFRVAVFCLFVCTSVINWSSAGADDGVPVILAHRGGAYEYEENTLQGFRACYEAGIRGFETDIRMTKDGVLVILHDDDLKRTHNGTGAIEQMTAAELKQITTKQGQSFLFLDELLEYFADKPGVMIELEMKTKNHELYPDSRIDEYCVALYEAAKRYRPEGSKYVFTSFDKRPLRAIRTLDAKAPTAFIKSAPLSEEFMAEAKELGANHIACRISGTSRDLVDKAHAQGFKVNCWPGRSPEDFYLAIGLGVDVHCTDIPTAIQKVKELLPNP